MMTGFDLVPADLLHAHPYLRPVQQPEQLARVQQAAVKLCGGDGVSSSSGNPWSLLSRPELDSLHLALLPTQFTVSWLPTGPFIRSVAIRLCFALCPDLIGSVHILFVA